MKSYFLEEVTNEVLARELLNKLLPSQSDPWLLQTFNSSDVVAYINLETAKDDNLVGPFVITADVSGRHYDAQQYVVDFLDKLRGSLGGKVTSD